MADNNSVSVSLRINGKDAENELSRLKQEVDSLRTAFVKAGEAGDRAMAEKFRKEIKKTEAEIRKMESGTKACQRVFAQLDKASPADLQRALKFLNSELKNIERGSAAWTAQTEKIRRVKAELDKVNAELRQSEGMFARMKNTVNDWGASIAAGAAAMAGLVAAGKAAVEAYAEMDQEMANVRKYTGMTAEQVDHLNEEFKKMDTRTSREALNQLAQEAGRLGKQSEEDVLGFVRAADKINVALDDLGEGATLTLSKLTNIFGDEERLGTERSLLAVGSVINELSQNSTASAPYLAEFAQRLAGVGAQAHMTIPEIMGFAAVLDSQGQKLEMSSTAVSKVIMNLFKSPEKIAKATGMAVNEFAETCKRSTNEGLLMLLNRLHELGGIDTLAPVFADMGENGARASAVLSALAGNVDMVRQQQQAANVAFQEAISIDKEFTVQNTTVQADLEKKKKLFREHAVELGEKLLPIMGHFHSSTSMAMKALSIIVDYVIEYKGALITLAAAIAGYTVAVKTTVAIEKLYNGLVLIGNGLKHAQRVAVLASSLAYNKLAGHTTRAAAAQKLLNATMKTNPWGLLVAGITAAVAGLVAYHNKQKEVSAADKAMKEIQGSITSQYAEQKGKIDMLLSTLENERNSLKKRKAALEELRKIVPGYHAELTNEGKLIRNNKKAIDDYLTALNKKIAMQAYEEKLAEQYRKKAELELKLAEQQKIKSQKHSAYIDANRNDNNTNAAGQKQITFGTIKADAAWNAYLSASNDVAATEESLLEVNKAIGAINTGMEQFADVVKTATTETEELEDVITPDPAGGGSGDAPAENAELKAIEDWKNKLLAVNKLAYMQGEIDFQTYTDRNIQAELGYWEDRVELAEVGSTEYYEALAKKAELEKKLVVDTGNASIQAEQERYQEEQRILQQRYADGELSHRAYSLAMEKAELTHLKNMVELYEEGSTERIAAQDKYQKASLKYQKQHAKEAEKIQERLKRAFFSKHSGVTDQASYETDKLNLDALYSELSAQATTNQQKLALDRAYREARYQLAKQYNDKEGAAAIDSLRSASDSLVEWLNSEGYQAFSQSFSTIVDGMCDIFSGLTDLIDAETELQTAQIEKKYERELAAAGGNKRKVAQIEAEKEKEIAAVKNEAEKKKYGMQVAAAVAQTAVAAINAFSSAAAIPIVGIIMAPIAAAMAIAAGAIQIATLKKQRDAALAQGYATGGYTRPGSKYEPAGIVHAGEWVASQELLANPTAAATIAALDEAQRTNTIGSLQKPSFSNNSSIVQQQSANRSAAISQSFSSDSAVLEKLNKRLDEPFVTVNTVTGDRGILRAQKKYDQLMKNKGKS
ncbi:MAG: phage tail tape measure protein [Paludibacteraceae bacterium]|nr:phage tail tape measure protein [Paludibacteraceae bacterium]